ncbi:uncharacterized protein BX663DRAFT_517454 [Cokeromyces recurvatus]|uniref:uncharacterized protein n=1 Tax=Cokeromyces recurvatus TaxID=90255 RepID=UPI002220CB49|nr:uncharacterized protein BX663DRAFT_517454 [Cokeromyces recurvatus]KAI7900405.1 hypothetical protein BX663DRAFT_517454 [Cokeromyces recurvatus]
MTITTGTFDPATTLTLPTDSSILNILTSSSISPTPSQTITQINNVMPSNKQPTNTGAIVGGVVGGVAGVALLGALAFLLIRRRKSRSTDDREVFHPQDDDDDDQQQPFQQSTENVWNQSDSSYPQMSYVTHSPSSIPPHHSFLEDRQKY